METRRVILKKVEGKCFANRDIPLDGRAYVGCTFTSCRFIFAGRKDFSLAGNTVSPDCVLVFRDRAANTISALTELYGLGDWGRNHVIATVSQIIELTAASDARIH